MNALTKQKHEHDEKVSKAIDKVLKKIFGDKATLLIYKYLENRYSLRQEEIVEKIDAFAEGLEEFLSSGAYIIEMRILEDIYSSYGVTRRLECEKRRNKYDFVSHLKVLMEKT